MGSKVSSRAGGRSSSRGKRDRQRDKSAGRRRENDNNSATPQQSLASTPEIVNDGRIELTTGEERQDSFKSNNRSGRRGSSTTPRSSVALQGGILLKALMFMRKVQSSSFRRWTSSREHSPVRDASEDGRKNRGTQDGEIMHSGRQEPSSVDRLEEELQNLRHRMDNEQAEMQRLRNEVSLLRLNGDSGNIQLPSHGQPVRQVDNYGFVSRSNSVRSDASQLSCLDFSLASTGMLKFEGELKAKIAPASHSRLGNRDQTTVSSLSDATAPSMRNEKNSQVTKVLAIEDVKSTTNSSALIIKPEQTVAVTKKSCDVTTLNESISEHDHEYVEKYTPDHNVADLKFVERLETVKKNTDYDVSPASHRHDAEEEFFFSTNAESQATENSNLSRSPPKSVSSTEEPDLVGSDDSVILQKTVPMTVTSSISEAANLKSSDAPTDLESLLEKSRHGGVVEMQYQELDELCKSLKVSHSESPKCPSETLIRLNESEFNSNELVIFTPPVEPQNYCSSVMENAPLKVSSNNSISRSKVAPSLVTETAAPLQVTELQMYVNNTTDISPVSPSAEFETSQNFKAQSRSKVTSNELSNISPVAYNSLAAEDAPSKMIMTKLKVASDSSRLPRSRSPVVSALDEAPGPFKETISKLSRKSAAATSSPPRMPSRSSHGYISSDRANWDKDLAEMEKLYPEHSNLTVKSLRGERTATSPHLSDDLISRPKSRSPSASAAEAEAPQLSLERSASFSEEFRTGVRTRSSNSDSERTFVDDGLHPKIISQSPRAPAAGQAPRPSLDLPARSFNFTEFRTSLLPRNSQNSSTDPEKDLYDDLIAKSPSRSTRSFAAAAQPRRGSPDLTGKSFRFSDDFRTGVLPPNCTSDTERDTHDDVISKATSRSPRTLAAAEAEAPRLSLDLPARSIFSDSEVRSGVLPWNSNNRRELQSKHQVSISRTASESMAGRNNSDVDKLQLWEGRNCNISYGDRAEVSNFPMDAQIQLYGTNATSRHGRLLHSSSSISARAGGLSPSRNSARHNSLLLEVHESEAKSQSAGTRHLSHSSSSISARAGGLSPSRNSAASQFHEYHQAKPQLGYGDSTRRLHSSSSTSPRAGGLSPSRNSAEFQPQERRWIQAKSSSGDSVNGLSRSTSSISQRAAGRSPLRNSAESQLYERRWQTKSGIDDNAISQTLSTDLTRDRSSEEIDLEEEVRQCLEQSRQLLSDATSNSPPGSSDEEEHTSARNSRLSREASCSVLALSRRRRNIEISRPVAQGSAKIQQDVSEQGAIVLYEDKTSKTQSSTVDVLRGEATEKIDFSVINPRRPHKAMESWDRNRTVQLEARDSKLRTVSSMPSPSRRSRFYLEANAAG